MNDKKNKQIKTNLIIFLSLTNVLLIGLTYYFAYKEVHGHEPEIVREKYVEDNAC